MIEGYGRGEGRHDGEESLGVLEIFSVFMPSLFVFIWHSLVKIQAVLSNDLMKSTF